MSEAENKPFIVAYHGSSYDFDKFDLDRDTVTPRGGFCFWDSKTNEEWNKFDISSLEQKPGETENGVLYQVRIHADPGKFLDMDKSYGDQPEAVKKFVAQANKSDVTPNYPMEILARSILRDHMRSGSDLEALAKKLRSNGVPGLTGLLPNVEPGDDVRKWIVFDPNIIQITHKDGVPVHPERGNAMK
jgi:hypothetical protein